MVRIDNTNPPKSISNELNRLSPFIVFLTVKNLNGNPRVVLAERTLKLNFWKYGIKTFNVTDIIIMLELKYFRIIISFPLYSFTQR